MRHPLTHFLAFVLFAGALIVVPYLDTDRFRVTASKIAALILAIAAGIYSGDFNVFFVVVWPISFIWFPEFWGGLTGFFQGQYITKKSPPVLVALMGWFLLVLFLFLSREFWFARR